MDNQQLFTELEIMNKGDEVDVNIEIKKRKMNTINI